MFGRKKNLDRFSSERQQPAQPFIEHPKVIIESREPDVVYPEKQARPIVAEQVSTGGSHTHTSTVRSYENIKEFVDSMVRDDIANDLAISNYRNEAYGRSLRKAMDMMDMGYNMTFTSITSHETISKMMKTRYM